MSWSGFTGMRVLHVLEGNHWYEYAVRVGVGPLEE